MMTGERKGIMDRPVQSIRAYRDNGTYCGRAERQPDGTWEASSHGNGGRNVQECLTQEEAESYMRRHGGAILEASTEQERLSQPGIGPVR
jgi:hypothetical protein